MLSFISIFYAYARPLIKWFLRRFTRLCELQRICYGVESGSKRKKDVEQSLSLSRQKKVRDLITLLNESVTNQMSVAEFHDQLVPHIVSAIMRAKKVKSKSHPDFGPTLCICVGSIWSYRQLCADVEDIRRTIFDSDNADHENKLLKLWRLLMPHQELDNRITKQWQDIGFQGDNPMTDFRGKFKHF